MSSGLGPSPDFKNLSEMGFEVFPFFLFFYTMVSKISNVKILVTETIYLINKSHR